MTVNTVGTADIVNPRQLVAVAEGYTLAKQQKRTRETIGLAMMAGIFIGLAFVFYLTVTTGSHSNWGLTRLAGGVAFSLGLILVVVCGAELFTSSVLSAIARANGQISSKAMLVNWLKVYLGNLLGALVLMALVMAAGMFMLAKGQWGLNALQLAAHKVHHSPLQAFSLGVLCNMLVCLAIWMTFSTSQILTKALLIMLPVAMFVSSGFEHCVANMFMVPLAIAIKTFAPAEFWLQTGVTASQFSELTWSHFVTANLIPVTLGNMFGGAILVGLSYQTIFQPKPAAITTAASPATTTDLCLTEDKHMLNDTLTIKDIMDSKPLTLSAGATVQDALDQLLACHISGAPVVDRNHKLVGFFSLQDALADMWASDFMPSLTQQVQDLMVREVQTVDSDESLLDFAEYLSVDKNKVYPVTSAGIALQMTNLSMAERAQAATPNLPHHFPVVSNGQLVGTVSRQQLMAALRPIYGQQLNLVPSHDIVA
ncbi:formate transporter FocA [Neiella sp. HB171785]|uniref:Formate transporter FocA n=1 Tax=Neiella litorisoli TaxID=2771431 RepID=A0A8J6UGD7_9GAMM|nr:formate transporter FocA [Neiella litorisoli]MBD1389926.1 formate transporter FocA [Neiella litorisoli]